MNYAIFNPVTRELHSLVTAPTGALPAGCVFLPEDELPSDSIPAVPVVPVVPVPETVQLYALRAVFALHGLTAKIDSAIAALPEPQKSIAFAHWNYGNTISRQHPLVLSLVALLGLSEGEADEIFRDAQTVEQGGTPDVKPEEVSMWQRLLNLFS